MRKLCRVVSSVLVFALCVSSVSAGAPAGEAFPASEENLPGIIFDEAASPDEAIAAEDAYVEDQSAGESDSPADDFLRPEGETAEEDGLYPGNVPEAGNEPAAEEEAGDKAAGENAAGSEEAGENAAGPEEAGENAAGSEEAEENAAGPEEAEEEAAGSEEELAAEADPGAADSAEAEPETEDELFEAESDLRVMYEPEDQEFIPDWGSSSDELFAGYVSKVFNIPDDSGLFEVSVQFEDAPAKTELTGVNAVIYSRIAEQIPLIARGDRTSTVFEISLHDLGFDMLSATGATVGEAISNLNRKMPQIQVLMVLRALEADFPYEMFWFNKDMPTTLSNPYSMAFGNSVVGYTAVFGGSVKLSLPVAEAYAAGNYQVDGAKLQSVQRAASNAQSIVKEYAWSGSDYEKLAAYRDRICSLTSYNYAALSDSASYGDPWQFIYVFDGDPGTNVVCEGYAKAFKYLCDMTEFSSDKVSCILVTGSVSGLLSSGGHMWNIVTMDDGRNYLVDVTNCDSGMGGYPDRLFLKGWYDSSVINEDTRPLTVYTYRGRSQSIKYNYDYLTVDIFPAEKLVLSDRDYTYVPDPARFVSARINLGERIALQFMVEPDGTVAEDDYLSIRKDGRETRIPVSRSVEVQSTTSGSACRMFEIQLKTTELNSEVTAQMVVGGVGGRVVRYSVRNYIDAILSGSSAEYQAFQPLARAMLNYGGYAQAAFGTAASGLVNEGLYDETNDPVLVGEFDFTPYDYKLDRADDMKGIDIYSATLLFESETELRFYFTLDEGKKMEDFAFSLANSAKTPVIGYNPDKGMYYAAVQHILATELDDLYTLTVTPKAESEPVITVTYGAFSYACSVTNSGEFETKWKNLVKAMYLYNQAADAYQASH